MAGGLSLNLVMFIAIMVASMQFIGVMSQTRHVVGDALGWTIHPGGAAAYTTWASQQTFTVGDILVFNFNNGEHDVAEVSAAAYDPCSSTNPISLITTSPASLTLTTSGPHYYICTFTSHCQIGQKLAINVSTSAASPPSTTSTPAAPPTTTPSMTPTTPSSPPTTPTPPIEPCPPTSTPSSSPLSPPTFTSGNTVPLPPLTTGAASFTAVVPAVVPAIFLAVGIAFLN